MKTPTSRRLRAALRWALLLSGVGLALASALLLSGAGDAPAWRTREATGAASEEGYDVEMSPVGRVHFRRPPRRIMTVDAHYDDMLVALDQARHQIASGYEGNAFDGFYDQLVGFDPRVNRGDLRFVGRGLDKETLYALGAEVHHVDPLRLMMAPGWTQADVDEIARNVGPFFANRFSRTHIFRGDAPYQFYSLWELTGKVAEVYRDADRMRALQGIYDEMVASIQRRLPPIDQRPRVGVLMPAAQGGLKRFTPFSLSRPGFDSAHLRAIGVRDAFAPIRALTYGDGQTTGIDLEGLLSIDPDVIVMPFAVYPAYRARFAELGRLAEHPLGRRLKAIQDHRLYPGGTPLQGPLFLIFQVEMAAKQCYPELFGPYRDDQRYPSDERLFDRRAVARVLIRGAAEDRL